MATYKVKNERGDIFDVEEDKLELAEKDGYLPLVSNGKDTFRTARKDLSKAAADGYKPVLATNWNSKEILEAEGEATKAAERKYELDNNPVAKFAKGLGAFNAGMEDWMPFTGVTDRLSAGVGAVVDQAKGTDKNLGSSFDENLKEIRTDRKERASKSPVANAAGAGFGAASNIIIPGGGAKAAAIMGGIEGGTQGEELSTGGAALGAVIGAGTAKLPKILATGGEYLKDAWGAFKGSNGGLLEAAKDVASSVSRRYSNSADMAKLRSKATGGMVSKMIEEGGDASKLPTSPESILHSLSDEEFVQYGILTGDDDVIQWAANRAATLHPGQVQAEEVYNALKMGHTARVDARDFVKNKADIAKELAPQVDDTVNKFENAVSGRVEDLTKQARQNFDPKNAEGIRSSMLQAFSDTEKLKSIPGGVRNRIEDAWNILYTGDAPSAFNLQKGPLAEADNVEHFKRLQKVREILDQGIDWDAIKAGKRRMDEGETILAGLRKEADTALKSAPGKTQADAVAKLGFEIQDAVFGKTELRGGVDEFKLKRLFGNTDEAGRFKNSLDKLKDWASDPEYAPEARDAANALIERFQTLYQLSDNANILSTLRYKNGPTSPAVEAFKSYHGKNSTTQDLVTATSGFINQTDEFIKQLPDITGKSFNAMNPEEKKAAIKLMVWFNKAAKNGKVATPESMTENYQKFLKNAAK